MRAIWSGTISFVLVNIPVKLYSAVSDDTINFDLLHKKDMSRIRYARVCVKEEKEVPYEEITRGYEYQKNQYVIVTDEELKAADPKKNYSIDIVAFINLAEIDPIYYDKPYYLEPDRGADKSYALLRDALQQSKKVALAKFVLRERERMVVLRPFGRALMLNQIRFEYQIRPMEGINLPVAAESKEELSMALTLINNLTDNFEPQNYHDDYREKVETLIAAKSKGEKIVVPSVRPKATHVEELMDRLRASLEESEKKTPTR